MILAAQFYIVLLFLGAFMRGNKPPVLLGEDKTLVYKNLLVIKQQWFGDRIAIKRACEGFSVKSCLKVLL